MDLNAELEELFKKLKIKDKQAYADIINLTRNILIKTAFLYLKDVALAEDIVNEFYIELPKKCVKIKYYNNIMGWMRTIVINKSINLLKKRKHEKLYDTFINDKNIHNQEQSEIENAEVRIALSQLNQNERLVLLLRAYGYTLEEISKYLNISLKKTRLLIERAKKSFIKLYGDLD